MSERKSEAIIPQLIAEIKVLRLKIDKYEKYIRDLED